MITIPIVLAVVMYLVLPTVGWLLCAFFTAGSRADDYARGYHDGVRAQWKETRK